ncbi:MAG: hypothetical protein CME64_15135 [Halobacteriovoraceae bacterium]|nr:hypothetical protein [Halobacteriovoraceae bacterium]|tara:strand:+ start:69651 stop:70340 length:690 start_codon:yes stop_codon:yes gene_type:complete
MRAIFLKGETFQLGAKQLTGEKTHHLLNVVRIKVGQHILLLNGNGTRALSSVESISKKAVGLNITSVEEVENKKGLSIAFALPKKDAFESALRACVEVGANEIIVLSTERSQTYPIKEDRVQKILTAAIEQSNNPYEPRFEKLEIGDLDSSKYGQVVLATLAKGEGTSLKDSIEGTLLVIGPEGGLTDAEELNLLNRGAHALRVNVPILRTQTAIPFLSGYLLGNAVDC